MRFVTRKQVLSLRRSIFVLPYLLLLVSSTSSATSRNIFEDVPPGIDVSGRYLFFLHGAIVEGRGKRPTSERFGVYEYERLLEAFSEKGFTVISEARGPKTILTAYAEKVTGQVHKLLDAGVPARNITVVGASKGGAIAIVVSSMVKEEDVNYALIATCGEKMINVMVGMGRFLTGNVLSIYEVSDELTCSCEKFFDLSKGRGLNRHREIRIDTGLHHGFHYKPLKEWVDPVSEWASGVQWEQKVK